MLVFKVTTFKGSHYFCSLWIFKANPYGFASKYFSKNSYYLFLLWNALWKLKIHVRIKVFGWIFFSNCLPTRGNIYSWINIIDISWPFCLNFIETTYHLFTSCHFNLSLGAKWSWTLKFPTLDPLNLKIFFLTIFKSNNSYVPREITHTEFILIVIISFEKIWKAKSNLLFNSIAPNLIHMVQNIEERF